MSRPPVLRVVAAVLAVGGVLTAATSPAAAATPPPGLTTYVSTGDSYAAGYGLPATEGTPTGQPVPGCNQTTGDYPRLLAGLLGVKAKNLTDVTCSGATTADYSAPQPKVVPPPAPQLDAVTAKQPALVTVTIGGNDLGFTQIINDCAAGSAQGPLGSHLAYNSCKDYYASADGSADDPYKKIPAVLAAVSATIDKVHAAAPAAKIAVIAYPAIAPDKTHTPTGGCFAANALVPPIGPIASAFPITDVDVPYLQVLQQQLDDGIKAVTEDPARASYAAYADIYPSSLAHSACETAASGARWVEPLIPAGGGNNVFHPNLAGTTAMAAALAPVVTALFTAATASPTAPAGGTGSSASATATARVPLAATGPSAPVWPLVGLGLAFMVSGAAIVLVGRTTERARRRL